ncbi:unnamed protein product [Musa banksii]
MHEGPSTILSSLVDQAIPMADSFEEPSQPRLPWTSPIGKPSSASFSCKQTCHSSHLHMLMMKKIIMMASIQ